MNNKIKSAKIKSIQKKNTKLNKNKKTLQQKFIFVTGGVVSSIGKGLTAASLGSLLEARGFQVTIMKFDPYLNVDPGTMSPFQHGEVYVTDDGAETDLDLGHYERFTHAVMSKSNSVSAGQIYDSVISRERKGDYLGGTVQVIPHITDEIKNRIFEGAQGSEIAIVEIGGTVGDIEGQPFFEAIRQVRMELGSHDSALIHVTYVPYIAVAGELKSKPTQHSVQKLREIGLQADFLVCRSEKVIDENLKSKLSLFCSVKKEHVIAAQDSSFIYEVPLVLHDEKLDDLVIERLGLKEKNTRKKLDIKDWKKIVKILKSPLQTVKVGVVGKYVDLKESYKSLHEALVHGGVYNKARVEVIYVDSEKLNEKNISEKLKSIHAILVPGGFGTRGVEGKLLAIRYARENKIPYFGICFGMQLAAIEFARNVCGLKDATSREFVGESKRGGSIVIDSMVEQRGEVNKGGTMRLGAYACQLKTNSRAQQIYKAKQIFERHRHRFEFNNKYRDLFAKNGLVFSGLNKERDLVEIIELPNHPWFIGVQFHPEFKSKPLAPHPLFSQFIKAALKTKNLN